MQKSLVKKLVFSPLLVVEHPKILDNRSEGEEAGGFSTRLDPVTQRGACRRRYSLRWTVSNKHALHYRNEKVGGASGHSQEWLSRWMIMTCLSLASLCQETSESCRHCKCLMFRNTLRTSAWRPQHDNTCRHKLKRHSSLKMENFNSLRAALMLIVVLETFCNPLNKFLSFVCLSVFLHQSQTFAVLHRKSLNRPMKTTVGFLSWR